MLDYDDRHRRRIAMTGDKGTAFLLDLPSPAELRGGDALLLEDGRLVEVVAAPERCWKFAAPMRSIWPASPGIWAIGMCRRKCCSDALRIRRDHVLADLARQLGADVVEIEAPFDSGRRRLSERACACSPSMSETRALVRRRREKRGSSAAFRAATGMCRGGPIAWKRRRSIA